MQIPCVYIPGPAPAVSVANTKACTIHALKEQYHDIFVSSVFLQKTSGPNRRVQERFKFFFP